MGDAGLKTAQDEKYIEAIIIIASCHDYHMLEGSVIRGGDLIKLKPVHARIQSYAASFILSVTNGWNLLPTTLLRETDTNTFESKLYKCYRDQY